MNADFKAVNDAARKDLLRTISDTDREILRIYQRAASDLAREAEAANDGSLTERWKDDMSTSLKERIRQLNGEMESVITDAARKAAGLPADAEVSWLDMVLGRTNLSTAGGASFRSVMTRTPDEALKQVVTGQAYDTNGNGIVDNAEKLGNQLPAYYRDASNVDAGTLPPQFGPFGATTYASASGKLADDLTDVWAYLYCSPDGVNAELRAILGTTYAYVYTGYRNVVNASNDRYQLAVAATGSAYKSAFRIKVSGAWSAWVQTMSGTAAEMRLLLGLQSNYLAVTAEANGWTDVEVTFPVPYTTNPTVVLTPRRGQPTATTLILKNRTTTGFTASVYNPDAAQSLGFEWIAVSRS